MRKTVLLFFALLAITACSKDDLQLRLSISAEETQVTTEGTEYTFEILSGAGDYVIKVSNAENYKIEPVSISGNQVTVQLIKDYTGVTVTDKAGQEQVFTIHSSDESLQAHNCSISIPYGGYMRQGFTWGSRTGYDLSKNTDESEGLAMWSYLNESEFIVTGLRPGSVFYTATDNRGTRNAVNVYVRKGCNMQYDSLDITLGDDISTQIQFSVMLMWGEGDIKITDRSEAFDNCFTMISSADKYQKYPLLLLQANEGAEGDCFIELVDEKGNKARVNVTVE